MLVRAAARARVTLVQLREKTLTARVLSELATRAVEICHDEGGETRLLVNDRADIARAVASGGTDCGCGVHLTTRSLDAAIVRRIFGSELLIGVSAHTFDEARAARDAGADFAVFGPVFDTPSKSAYGAPVGLDELSEAAHALAPFPLLALGGVTQDNALEALRAGARGVAAIRLFADAGNLEETVCRLNQTSRD